MTQPVPEDHKAGRLPATGRTAVEVMLEAANLIALDAWIADQPEQVGRPEAVRTLLREALPSPNTTTIRSEFG